MYKRNTNYPVLDETKCTSKFIFYWLTTTITAYSMSNAMVTGLEECYITQNMNVSITVHVTKLLTNGFQSSFEIPKVYLELGSFIR